MLSASAHVYLDCFNFKSCNYSTRSFVKFFLLQISLLFLMSASRRPAVLCSINIRTVLILISYQSRACLLIPCACQTGSITTRSNVVVLPSEHLISYSYVVQSPKVSNTTHFTLTLHNCLYNVKCGVWGPGLCSCTGCDQFQIRLLPHSVFPLSVEDQVPHPHNTQVKL